MRSIAFWALISALGVGRSLGADFFATSMSIIPNHLVPINSFMTGYPNGYDVLLVKHLFVTEGSLGRMLVRPSFSPEFCLSVDAEQVKHSDQEGSRSVASKEKVEQDRYRITVTTAAENIWYARRRADGKPVHVKIERTERKISRDLAVAIQRVWAKALLLTRYPAYPEAGEVAVAEEGFDGTTYQFSVHASGSGTMEGETWEPKQGLPLQLTNIGLDLVAFARQDAKGKKMTEKQFIDRLRKLESAIPTPQR
jgi:hypothetical protein